MKRNINPALRFTGGNLLRIAMIMILHINRGLDSTMAKWLAIMVLGVLPAVRVWAGPPPPVRNEGELPADVLSKPVVVYSRPYTSAVYADYVPDAEEIGAEFSAVMARNETEPMQVGLYVPADKEALKDVRLQLTCPVPSRVGRIHYSPASEQEFLAGIEDKPRENVRSWRWPVDRKLLVGRRVSMPLYVVPVATIETIKPGMSAAFWVTFQTDETFPGGTWKGTFTLSAEGEVLETIPFTLTVHSFVLPRPRIHYGMYHIYSRPELAYQGRDFLKQSMADMAAHGMNFIQFEHLSLAFRVLAADKGYNRNSSTPVPEDADGLTIDSVLRPDEYLADGGYNAYALIDKAMRLCREAGLLQRDHSPIAYASGWNSDPTHKARLMEVLREQMRNGDWPHFVLYMRDEPPRILHDQVTEQVAEWRRLGAPTTAAMSGAAAFAVGDVHSTWIVLAGHISPELLREAERTGAEVWTYDFNLRTTNVKANRYYAGLYTWSQGLKGNICYAYMPGRPNPHPYFDADWKLSGMNILGYVIPSPTGPVPGVGWEGRREGVDDVRFLQLLEARVDGASADNPTAQEASRWLARLRSRYRSTAFYPNQFNAMGTDYMDPDPELSPADYDGLRTTAARYISALPAVAGESNPEPLTWHEMQSMPMEADAFAKASAEECLTALRTGSIKQKRQAAGALALRDASAILPSRELLIDLLGTPEVRMVALRALAHLGPEAAPALPAIHTLLTSKDVFIRLGATYVLTRIGPDAADLLAECADDPHNAVSSLARNVLEELKEQSAPEAE